MKYKTISLLTLFYAVFSIVYSIFCIIRGSFDLITRTSTLIDISSLIFTLVILVSFKKFIREKLNFYGASNIINLIIIIKLITSSINLGIYLLGGNIKELMNFDFAILLMTLKISYGVLLINFGAKLKKICNKESISTYSSLIIISGLLILSVIGINISKVVIGISYIYLYFIFREENKFFIGK